LSIVERERGRLGLALELAEQAVGHAAGCGHRRVEAQARSALAAVHLARGEAQFARDHWARALRLAGDTGHPQPEVDARIGLARAERALGHHQEARAHLEQALAAAQASEFGLLEARALTERAALRIELGQPEAARVDAERALAMHEVCGYPMGMAETLVLLGHVGPLGPDLDSWRRALDIYTRIGAVTATLISELIDSHEVVRPRADDRPRVGQNGQHQEGSIP
jgi:tetratricopeptide (TPR) repeat protein